jgi:hypothetical protein
MAKSKKSNLWVIGLVGILILGGAFLAHQTGLLAITSENTLVIPLWARYQCELTTNYEGLEQTTIQKSGGWIDCGRNEYTDDCKVSVTLYGIEDFLYTKDMVSYQLCQQGGDCYNAQTKPSSGSSGSEVITLPNIESGQTYKINCYGAYALGEAGKKTCDVTKTYKVAKIHRYTGGAIDDVSAQNCVLPNTEAGNLLSTQSLPTGNKLSYKGATGLQWINYPYAWVYSPLDLNAVQYNGQLAYCEAGSIYSIVKVTTKDGKTYNVAPDKSVENKEYAVEGFNIVGNKIATVECCPAVSPNCVDFKWKIDSGENKSCFSDVQCLGAGQPIVIDATKYYTQTCQSGKCKNNEPTTVECTSDRVCPSGQVCDLTLVNYGKCVDTKGQGFCGDKVCQVDESKNSCPTDCGTINQFTIPNWVWAALIILCVGIVSAVAIALYTMRKKR